MARSIVGKTHKLVEPHPQQAGQFVIPGFAEERFRAERAEAIGARFRHLTLPSPRSRRRGYCRAGDEPVSGRVHKAVGPEISSWMGYGFIKSVSFLSPGAPWE